MRKKKILVAMSGGVDSAVAALLLKEAGNEVAGATIRTWISGECAARDVPKACCGFGALQDAREIAEQLGIPYWVFNFEKEFKQWVMDPFASEYMKGRTPNPCIACNEHIKFRFFWEKARGLGFEAMATGHYAGIGRDEKRNAYYLEEGRDPAKDQSYVLFPLRQDLLAHLHLPLGKFTKAEIRAMAKAKNFKVWSKPDSQEICFVPQDDYGAFLRREYLNEKELPGDIRMADGKILGRHQGYLNYTRGQRRGLGVAYRERLYVLGTDPGKNEVIVGTKKEVFNQTCVVGQINWFLKPETKTPFRAHVKIRSQHPKAPAVLTVMESGSVQVIFDQPQDAITPGQAAVFYDGAVVLGGGWIDSYV